ncbi:MAG: hypothetical protein OHK0019_06940 [Saprospiraceae bacterium]
MNGFFLRRKNTSALGRFREYKGYDIYLFEPGETKGKDYAFFPLFPPDESNCFLGFRVASD